MDDAPGWFRRSLASIPEHREVEVDAARVHYRAWGDPGGPGVVLVHGGSAHSGWWDHVAPLLQGHRLVALDLTGHGDSGGRHSYSTQQWADDVAGVIAAEDLRSPVVIGHSMGGFVAVSVGVAYPDAVSGVVIIDSPLNDRAPEQSWLRERRKPTKVYASQAAAMSRFVTLPPQALVLPYVGKHVARQSLRQVEGGWTWKFDPAFIGTSRQLLREMLPLLGCPVVLLRCEHGLVSTSMAAEMETLSPRLPVVDLADAGHHPMLDQPLALAAALRALLAVWPTR